MIDTNEIHMRSSPLSGKSAVTTAVDLKTVILQMAVTNSWQVL